ncbi:hypothetical protein RF11_10357 [Thelohanellus kitauei]|uniref:Uncharacterized protein n=1 Tax=Thelohanellus kitauei TaxID=669202 RepID=A0A0C2M9Z7_THEKT|nr:hypothetical protein RF11_10357 [Thelohanellus kitauei]
MSLTHLNIPLAAEFCVIVVEIFGRSRSRRIHRHMLALYGVPACRLRTDSLKNQYVLTYADLPDFPLSQHGESTSRGRRLPRVIYSPGEGKEIYSKLVANLPEVEKAVNAVVCRTGFKIYRAAGEKRESVATVPWIMARRELICLVTLCRGLNLCTKVVARGAESVKPPSVESSTTYATLKKRANIVVLNGLRDFFL